ncbi:LOW QUALITY PROTEIN: MAPK/MAK/MRK overlapping kinase [Leptosomus discolor]
MNKYEPVGRIGEGTFFEGLKTLSLRDGKCYACKHRKQHFESVEQVNNLREIQLLRRQSLHPNTLMLHEVPCPVRYVADWRNTALSQEHEPRWLLGLAASMRRRKPLPESMYQLRKSLDYIHGNGIFQRDVKPEKLIKPNTLQSGDFGSCRSIYYKQPRTEYISTHWYRAPECLLTNGFIACFEPVLPGSNVLDQISKIHHVIGTPATKTLHQVKQSRIVSFDFPFKKGKGIPPTVHNLSPKGSLSLLYAMIKYDPDERIAAHQALQHPYFQEPSTDRQALAMHKNFRLLGNTSGQVPLHLWQTSKESQRQAIFNWKNCQPIQRK